MSHYNYYQTDSKFHNQEKKLRKKQFRHFKRRSRLARDFSIETVKSYFSTNKIDNNQKKTFWVVTKLNDYWLKICGPILYPYLRIHQLQGTKLTLFAQSGIWLQQAKFLERELIKKIKIELPTLNLESIEIRVQYFQTKKVKSTSKSKLPKRQKSKSIQFHQKKSVDNIKQMSLKQKMQYMLDKTKDS